MNDGTDGLVTCEVLKRDDGTASVAVVTLTRAKRHNALSTILLEQLVAHVQRLDADPERPGALVLTGAGASFCSGADIAEPGCADLTHRAVRRELFRRIVELLQTCKFATLAAVHGYALGGGLEIALACDLVVSEPEAVFGLPELAAGNVPGGGAVNSLARRAGHGLAADMLLTGRRLTGAEMFAAGPVDRLCGPDGALADAVRLAWGIAAHDRDLLELAVGQLRHTASPGRLEALAVEDGYWWRAAAGRAAR